jgi:hypothetical protein
MATADDQDQETIENIEATEEDSDSQAEGEIGEQLVESEGEEAAGSEEKAEDDADEVVVSIGEESPPQEEKAPAPEWVRELRKSNREKERRIRELEAKLTSPATESKPVAVGEKPKLESYDYDTEKFEAAIADWYERKRVADQRAEQQRLADKAMQDAWQEKLTAYSQAKTALKVRDFEDAEETVTETLDVTQQGVVLQGSDNPALVVYALGKNPKKAKELASIKDPVKFAFAVAKLEKDLKVTNRKAAPPPERTVQGTGRVSGAVDSTLERLRAEAEKTGNYTKVVQYKRQKQAAKT